MSAMHVIIVYLEEVDELECVSALVEEEVESVGLLFGLHALLVCVMLSHVREIRY